jgi:hypothetical protein
VAEVNYIQMIDELKFKLCMAENTASDYWRLVVALREGLQEIYAMRGEDKLIAKIASPLIDKSAP